jgi:hypothetical protein
LTSKAPLRKAAEHVPARPRRCVSIGDSMPPGVASHVRTRYGPVFPGVARMKDDLRRNDPQRASNHS